MGRPCDYTRVSEPLREEYNYQSSGSLSCWPLFVFGTGTALAANLPDLSLFRYPEPSNHGVRCVIFFSKAVILSAICIVSPMSSRPLIKQCFVNSATSKLQILLPDAS